MIDWLPSLFNVNPWTEDTYNELYKIFCRDIRDNKLLYAGNNVWIFPGKEDGKEKIFWHLTDRLEKKKVVPRRKRKFYAKQVTSGDNNRLPDLRRCERLPWIKPVIENSQKQEVLTWDYMEGDKKIKTYVWLKDEKYVVVMKKYKNDTRRLITAFYVDRYSTDKKLVNKYNKRIKN